jgi:DNA-binding MarR family transcriptional regulator
VSEHRVNAAASRLELAAPLEHGRAEADTSPLARSAGDERLLWRALARLHGDVVQHLEQELRPTTGLTISEIEALYELSDAPGRRLQLHQLARRLGFSRSAATRLVDRLQGAGYVDREANAADKRGTHAVLTAKGEEMLESARELYEHVLHYALLRHRSLEGFVVYTTSDLPLNGGASRPSWYRVQFSSTDRR